MRKTILILTLGILINACATLPSTKIPQSFSPNNDSGMVIGSIAFKNEKPIFNGYMFYYTGNGIKNLKMRAQKMKAEFFYSHEGDDAAYHTIIH